MTVTNGLDEMLLRGGRVIDGSGRPAFVADVAIRGERITRIGDLRDVRAIREVDASGLVVAPGFIDVHTHDDASLIGRPEMTFKLTQGVTTVIAGNCGVSGAPYEFSDSAPDLMLLVFKSERFTAPTFAEYVQKVADAGPALNAGLLTGHATLRVGVMGADLSRSATPSECSAMRDLLAESLQAGSLGLSTGLFYPPARAASTQEVIEIARPLATYHGVYATHMRDEADGVIASLQESFEIGRTAGVSVIVSHHKCMGQRNFGRSKQTLAMFEEAGDSVALDLYPYTAGSTILNEEIASMATRTVITWCDPYPQYAGRDLADVAQEWGCTPLELIPRLRPAGALYFTMDEEDIVRIMRYRKTMIGSDGLPEDQHPHPRLWGTFPRVLGSYVREQGVLGLEEAVHRMTGLSAARFGLRERGRVEVGNFADLCLFDPTTVLDKATYENPAQPAVGIQYVFVNGRLALDNGTPTGTRAGKVLRRAQDGLA